jgi:hypothetical protein
MLHRKRWLVPAAVALALAVFAARADAGRCRYHYLPSDGPRGACLKPDLAAPTGGERITLLGTRREPAPPPPPPTVSMTYRHPCSGRSVTVPLCLPPDTPRIEYRYNRIIYNYGSETVEVVFLTDGSVDVVYNSGLLRAP